MTGISERERQRVIMRLVEADGQVTVAKLVEQFQVTAVTIRKDLETLEQQRVVDRVRGGAVLASTADEGAFELRLRHRSLAKQAIARSVSGLVNDGDAVILDCSTSAYYLACELRSKKGLVVVTNGLRSAEVLTEAGATVVVPGGTIRRSSWSLVGDFGDVVATRGRVRIGFFSVRALSPQLGLMELSSEEALAKRRLVSACRSVHALVDSSKLDGFALHSFATPDLIAVMHTDELADPALLAPYEQAGVAVERVSIDQSSSEFGSVTEPADSADDSVA